MIADTTSPSPAPAAPTAERIPLRVPAGRPIPELFPHQAEREKIFRLAATYEPARVPEIAGFLHHPDATVRDAARLGLLQLGDAAAVPYLEAARAENQDEKQLLAEAIEHLKIPPVKSRPAAADSSSLDGI